VSVLLTSQASSWMMITTCQWSPIYAPAIIHADHLLDCSAVHCFWPDRGPGGGAYWVCLSGKGCMFKWLEIRCDNIRCTYGGERRSRSNITLLLC